MKVTIVIYVFFFNIKNTFKLKYKNGNKSLLNKLTCGSVVSHITVLPGVGKQNFCVLDEDAELPNTFKINL